MRLKLMLCGVSTLIPALLLTGCGMDQVSTVTANVESAGVAGRAFGGQQPVAGATISVIAMGTTGYGSTGTVLSSTTTDANGNFSLPGYTCPRSDTPVYLLGIGGNSGTGDNPSAVLGAGLGQCANAQKSYVILNEVTTVGLAFTLSHFFSTTLGGANGANDWFGGPSTTVANQLQYSQGIVRGNDYTIPSIIETAVGAPTQNSPGITIEAAKINTIANILAACINTSGSPDATETKTPCGKLFNWTQDGSATRPSDTLQAAVQMALHPTTEVANLYNLGTTTPPFSGLATQPNDWSIGVSFTTSSLGLGVDDDSVSTVDIDSTGKVWFPSNASGQGGAAYFDPTTLTFGGPFNSTTNKLTHPQQVAVDANSYVWLNDSAGASVLGFLTSAPNTIQVKTLPGMVSNSLTIGGDDKVNLGVTSARRYRLANISANRSSISLDTSFAFPFPVASIAGNDTNGDGVVAVDAVTADQWGYNVTSPTTSTNVFQNINYTGQVVYTGSDNLAVQAWVSGGNTNDGLCIYSTGTCDEFAGSLQNSPAGIAIDGAKTLWVAENFDDGVLQIPVTNAAGTGGSAYVDSTSGTIPVNELLHDSANGGTLTGPMGIGIDDVGNVWVSNAGCTLANCTPGAFTLTEIIGAGYPTINPVSAQITNGNLVGTEPTQ